MVDDKRESQVMNYNVLTREILNSSGDMCTVERLGRRGTCRYNDLGWKQQLGVGM